MLQKEISHLVVRNTFVDIETQTQETSRCSSVPPSLRLACEIVYEGGPSHLVSSDVFSDCTSRRNGLANFEFSGMSTQPGASRSMSEASEDSQVDGRWGEKTNKEEVHQMVTEPNLLKSANAIGAPVPVPLGIYTSKCQSEWYGQWRNMKQSAQAHPIEHACDSMPAKRLNSLAVAWKPHEDACEVAPTKRLSSAAVAWKPSTAVVPKVIYGKFHRQYRDAVEQVRAAIASCKCVGQLNGKEAVKVQEGLQSWHVTVCLLPTSMHRKELLLSIAKEVLLYAAEHSESIYVLGYGRHPFTVCPDGFTARLGGLWEQSVLCCDAFVKGVCYREGCCKFQHPAYQSILKVSVVSE